MIENVVLKYLLSVLSVPVHFERPGQAPDKFVLIDRTGGERTNHINRATFAIQSYAPSLEQAAQLNEEVKTAMDNVAVLDEIGSSSLNSDYNFTDTTKKEYRYQAVYDIVY